MAVEFVSQMAGALRIVEVLGHDCCGRVGETNLGATTAYDSEVRMWVGLHPTVKKNDLPLADPTNR